MVEARQEADWHNGHQRVRGKGLPEYFATIHPRYRMTNVMAFGKIKERILRIKVVPWVIQLILLLYENTIKG